MGKDGVRERVSFVDAIIGTIVVIMGLLLWPFFTLGIVKLDDAWGFGNDDSWDFTSFPDEVPHAALIGIGILGLMIGCVIAGAPWSIVAALNAGYAASLCSIYQSKIENQPKEKTWQEVCETVFWLPYGFYRLMKTYGDAHVTRGYANALLFAYLAGGLLYFFWDIQSFDVWLAEAITLFVYGMVLTNQAARVEEGIAIRAARKLEQATA